MVDLLLDNGASPNGRDGPSCVWVRLLQSLYQMTCGMEASEKLQEDVQTWFAIVRSFLIHGAHSDAKVPALDAHDLHLSSQLRKTLHQRLQNKEPQATGHQYSVLDMVRLLFGGRGPVDVSELEDLIESGQENDADLSRSTTLGNAG